MKGERLIRNSRNRPTGTRSSRRRGALLLLLGGAFFLVTMLSACNQGVVPTAPSSGGAWTDQDIGSVTAQGSASQSGSAQSWTMEGGGSDIWGTSDAFNFNYQQISGDVTITTHVKDIQHVGDWSKAGVMIRASDAAGAANVYAMVTPVNGTAMQVRATSGATTTDVGTDTAIQPPTWLRLQRVGDTFTAYESADGSTWTQLGSTTVSMPSTVLVGLAVTSHTQGTLAEAVFDSTTTTASSGSGGTTPSPSPPSGGSSGSTGTSGTTTITYQQDTSTFPNPERGWYTAANPPNYAQAAAAGFTLVHQYVRLDAYTNSALPASFLSGLQTDFAAARGSGVKIVLRFTYNFGYSADAPLNIVLEHISQLKPLLQQYSGSIAVLEAGFIGAWGEWHDSTNNLTTLSARQQITNALLAALPTSRMIVIRYPYLTSDMFPLPFTQSAAFNGSNHSRVGQHNDCFLANGTDGGTYTSDADHAYVQAITQFAPMGGETCDVSGVSTRSDCTTALSEMATYHWDYLDQDYYAPVIDKWKTQGCFNEISQRLGYRYTLQKLTSPTVLSPGATVGMSLTVNNSGFGILYNPRPMRLVFVPAAGGSATVVTVSNDARKVLPGPGQTVTIPVSATLPASLATGSYKVYLDLPDASSYLQSDPAYSIRLADTGMWVSSNGYNDLNLKVTVQ